jgi:competence protein ComEC
MIAVAMFVASLPGAVGRMAAFGTGPLLLGTGGLVVLCLLKSPLRVAGGVVVVAASLWAIATPQPDVLISPDGQVIAARGADGRLTIKRIGRDAFAAKEWLAADGDARPPDNKNLDQGFRCDTLGCIARLADGKLVSVATSADAFAEDCRKAALVVTARHAPPACDALIVDRNTVRARGAMALRRKGEGWEITAARPAGQDRPWARGAEADTTTAPAARQQTQPRDATPRSEDLEAGD